MKKKTKRKPLKRRRAQRMPKPEKMLNDLKALDEFVQLNFQNDLDYGLMEGQREKILFKPGADKLARYFCVYPEYTAVHEVKLSNEEIDSAMTVRLVDATTGKTVWTSAICSANSVEDDFRFRWIRPVCTTCNGIQRSCAVCSGSGFYRPSNERAAQLIDDGIGKWVPDEAGSIVLGWHWYEKREHRNKMSQWNRVRQQAGKRAFVQAIRSYGCVGKIFGEDVGGWYDVKREQAKEKTQAGRIVMEKN
jgi:hypothetical protein